MSYHRKHIAAPTPTGSWLSDIADEYAYAWQRLTGAPARFALDSEEAKAKAAAERAAVAAADAAKEKAADAKMAAARGVAVPPPLTAAQQPGAITLKYTERTLGKTGVTIGVAAAVGVTALLGAWMWSKHS